MTVDVGIQTTTWMQRTRILQRYVRILKSRTDKLEAANKELISGAVQRHYEWDGACFPWTCGVCLEQAREQEDLEHSNDCPAKPKENQPDD